jgi:hypothetical protein
MEWCPYTGKFYGRSEMTDDHVVPLSMGGLDTFTIRCSKEGNRLVNKARQFLEILEATSSEDQKQLETVVPKVEYRNVFLKLSRNLAPTGRTFDSIEFRTATGDAQIALTPEARTVINQTLKKGRPVDVQDSQATEEEIIGILRAVDLDKDFLDVAVRGDSVHVIGLGDTMDDVIGPMVNRVKILVVHAARNSIRLRDIELDE